MCSSKNKQNAEDTQSEIVKTNEDTGNDRVEEVDTVSNRESDNASASNDKYKSYHYSPPKELIDKAAATIIEMVKNRDKKGISEIIGYYPFEREYPIPPIKDEKEFIERFDEIFDAKLTTKIKNVSSDDWDSFGWRGLFMTEKMDGYTHLFLGFFTDSVGNPYIYSIECSETEAKKAKGLIELEREELHESLKSFLYPVVLMETPTHLIRIDRIAEKDTVIGEKREIGYRYASWKKGSSISDKPDLVLTNGIQFVDGSGCYTSYEFINGNYGYSCGVGMWGYPQYIVYFGVYKNVRVDEEGRIGCEYDDILIWKENKGDRSEIQLVYWSERSKLK